ncbi:MAG: LON peptidase substrate-binding domain-containing protein [Magnetovibrio sp.]|nr:LON peptidase substrate-binding domain-containing protein [Magnetovibrio sp.]
MVATRTPDDLPNRLAVFPLSGIVLMPFGHLPLNVFETRYLNMIEDALGTGRIKGRILGMIQPRHNQTDLVADDAPLYDIGTAGRIVQFQDPGNGRYLITLEGLARFRVTATIPPDPDRGYRWVEANFEEFEDDLNPVEHKDGPGRERLLELMHDYFGDNDIAADWGAVSDAPYDALIASLAMSCPFAPQEKQALLECTNHEQRARMLISLFEMNTNSIAPDPGSLKH